MFILVEDLHYLECVFELKLAKQLGVTNVYISHFIHLADAFIQRDIQIGCIEST